MSFANIVPKKISSLPPKMIENLDELKSILNEKRKVWEDKQYSHLVHEPKKEVILIDDYDRKLKTFDKQLSKIEDIELADYLILTSIELFGKIELEEIPLLKEYKKKFGNVKTIKEHLMKA